MKNRDDTLRQKRDDFSLQVSRGFSTVAKDRCAPQKTVLLMFASALMSSTIQCQRFTGHSQMTRLCFLTLVLIAVATDWNALQAGDEPARKTEIAVNDAPPPPPSPRVHDVSTADSPLKRIEVKYGEPMARLEMQTTISADGQLRHIRTDNKVFGNGDKSAERTEMRSGKLTPEQMKDLARIFAGWEALSSRDFIPVPDAPGITIRYGGADGVILPVGRGIPKQVDDIYRRINELAAAMPQAAATTQSALNKIELEYISPMEHLEIHTTISETGVWHSVRTDSRSSVKKKNRIETRQGQLTPEQIKELTAVFEGWKDFSTKDLRQTNDGAGINIRYGSGRAIPVADGMPQQVHDAYKKIRELTALTPVLKN